MKIIGIIFIICGLISFALLFTIHSVYYLIASLILLALGALIIDRAKRIQ